MPREDATGPTSRLQPRLWPLLPHIGWKMRPQPSQKGLAVKNAPANLGETQGSTPGSGRSPGGGNGNPFQFSCLETPMDSGAWWATAPGSAKSRHDWATKAGTRLPPSQQPGTEEKRRNSGPLTLKRDSVILSQRRVIMDRTWSNPSQFP